MIVFVEEEHLTEFWDILLGREAKTNNKVTQLRQFKFIIEDKNYDLVKHIAKRCRA